MKKLINKGKAYLGKAAKSEYTIAVICLLLSFAHTIEAAESDCAMLLNTTYAIFYLVIGVAIINHIKNK
jgi:hypothetical protein